MADLNRAIAALFAVAILIVVGLSLLAVLNAREAREIAALTRESRERLLLLEQLNTRLFEVESSQRAFAASGAPVFLEEHAVQRRDLALLLRRLEDGGLPADADNARLRRLRELVLQRLDIMDDLIRTRQGEGAQAAAAKIASQEGKHVMDRVREVVRELGAQERARLEQRRALGQEHTAVTIYTLLGGALLDVLLLGAAFAVVRREWRRNAQLLAELHRSNEQITRINELNAALLSCDSREDAAGVLRHFLSLLFPGMPGALYLMRASRNLLNLGASWGEAQAVGLDSIERNDCWALRLGHSHEVRSPASDLRCAHPPADAGAYLCVPMSAQGETAALLYLQADDPARLAQARERAEVLAIHAGASLSGILLREELRQQNVRDPLTNLYNRRHLEEIVPRELMRARRNGSSVGVVMVDIDHFKRFNDQQGHPAGDVVISEFSRYLQASVRGEDIACRYGGEEFVLVLPGASTEQCRMRAETLCKGAAMLTFQLRGERLPGITASFGVATFPEHGEEWDAILHRADAALYEAKGAGRNRVRVAGDIASQPAAAQP